MYNNKNQWWVMCSKCGDPMDADFVKGETKPFCFESKEEIKDYLKGYDFDCDHCGKSIKIDNCEVKHDDDVY